MFKHTHKQHVIDKNLSKNLQIVMKIKTKSNFYSDGSYVLTKSVKTHTHTHFVSQLDRYARMIESSMRRIRRNRKIL